MNQLTKIYSMRWVSKLRLKKIDAYVKRERIIAGFEDINCFSRK